MIGPLWSCMPWQDEARKCLHGSRSPCFTLSLISAYASLLRNRGKKPGNSEPYRIPSNELYHVEVRQCCGKSETVLRRPLSPLAQLRLSNLVHCSTLWGSKGL